MLQKPGVVAMIWIAAILHVAMAFRGNLPRHNKFDFSHYYVSAYAARNHIDPYVSDLTPIGSALGLETGILIHADYTPSFIAVFEPLTLMAPEPAYVVWMSLSAILFVTSMWMLLAGSGLPAMLRWNLAAFTLLYSPVIEHFWWGQSQIIVLFLMVLMMRSMERGRDGVAGIALAIAGLLRAFPLLLVGYLILARKRRALSFTAGGIVVGMAATIAALGFRTTMHFIHGAAWGSSYLNSGQPVDISVAAFVSRLFWYGLGSQLSPGFEHLRRLAALAAEALLLMLTLRASLARQPDDDRDWLVFSLWTATAILISPIAWLHYMVLLLLPFSRTITAAYAGRADATSVWMVVASAILAVFSLGEPGKSLISPLAGVSLNLPTSLRIVGGFLGSLGFLSALVGYLTAYRSVYAQETRPIELRGPAKLASQVRFEPAP